MNEKMEYVMRYIRLGMTPLKAMITAELSDEEIDILNDDPMFTRKTQLVANLEEVRLLEAFDRILDMTIEQGDSKDVKWKLAKLDPARWGDTSKMSLVSGKEGVNFTFNLGEGKALLGADNVEEHAAEDVSEKELVRPDL